MMTRIPVLIISGGNPVRKNITRLGKMIGNEQKIELKAFVQAVRSSCNLQTHQGEVNDEKVEKFCPFQGWCTPEVVRKHWIIPTTWKGWKMGYL